MPLFERSLVETTRHESSESDQILRFRAAERHLHWAIAVPFKVCYLSALILVLVYNPNPGRPFREIVSWIHRLSGVCLAVLPGLTIARHRRDFRIHLYNIRQGWSWKLDDLKWLFLMGPATVNKSIELPHQGKFNAGEKLNFMSVMATYPLYVVTGLLIWFSAVPYLPWLVHFSMALLATPLMMGHIFMATVNPDTRVGLQGMLTGFVDRHWARHHYRLWYDEHFGSDLEQVAHASGSDAGHAPGAIRYPALVVERRVVPRLWPREPVPHADAAACSQRTVGADDLPSIAAPDDAGGIVLQVEADSARRGPGGVAGAALAS